MSSRKKARKRVLSDFIESLESERTRELYSDLIGLSSQGLSVDPDKVISQVRSGELDRYQFFGNLAKWIHEKKLAPSTSRLYVSVWRGFFSYEDLPIDGTKLKRKHIVAKGGSISMDSAPTETELRSLLSNASLKLRAIIAVGATSGLRPQELADLKVSQIKFGAPSKIIVLAPEAKNRNQRISFISDEATFILKEFLGSRTEGSLFRLSVSGITSAYSRLLDKCGLQDKVDESSPCKRLHLYSLRKFFISFLQSKGAPEGIVQCLSGHQGYLNRSYSRFTEEQLIEAYRPMQFLKLMSAENGVLRNQVRDLAKELEEERTKRSSVETELKELRERIEKIDREVIQPQREAYERLSKR